MTTCRSSDSISTPLAKELTATELDRAGLLHADHGAIISRFAIFVPADAMGIYRPITLSTRAVIGAYAVIHGGTTIGEQARVEEHAVAGKPEHGYAMGKTYPGTGGNTVIHAGAVVRSGAIMYAHTRCGQNTMIGHHTVLHTNVEVGAETQLGHHVTVEWDTCIGRNVRCSPGSHLTSATRIADRVFLGAGVRTISDKRMTGRDPHRKPVLDPPKFDTAARVGSGSVVLAGVTIGEHALIGAGSLVTRDIPAGTVAYGQPARVHGTVC
jgi:acetyltransferase-like isoleucine patch superfamily enzyme